ncbi:hypothetical protein P280DRAFT_500817 [Massarina eburnea CBS 473.64]|uniref:rRNA-processing protein EFG1 n=1 Tax=Massarina eburnea CBS 473.64 TaxID=1395130 RepID=A0A6A6RT67_9PLEO|nr:hypothetical protein P280DRAFT_500817 [Massarina eburnea CBS 473.64]
MADIHPSRKRKLGDALGDAGGGSQKAKWSRNQRRSHAGGHGKKHGAKPSSAPPSDANSDSTNVLKRRIRDLKRMLNHLDSDPTKKMPQTVRMEQERELAACEHELAEKVAQKLESDFKNKIIHKYHGVRFFERKKAMRNIKRMQKQLAEAKDESETAALLPKIHSAEVDLNYTTAYPLLRPYVSIFPRPEKAKGESEADKGAADKQADEFPDGPKGNVDMWKAVEKAMEDGTLEKLRNSREGVTIPGPEDPIFEWTKKTANDIRIREEEEEEKRKEGKAPAPQPGDGDSDGGFFE